MACRKKKGGKKKGEERGGFPIEDEAEERDSLMNLGGREGKNNPKEPARIHPYITWKGFNLKLGTSEKGLQNKMTRKEREKIRKRRNLTGRLTRSSKTLDKKPSRGGKNERHFDRRGKVGRRRQVGV